MADVTISDLNPLSVTSGLLLPVSNGSSTGKITVGNINSLVTKASIGLGNVEDKSSETIRSEITNNNVASALGITGAAPIFGVRAWVNFNGFNDITNTISNTFTNRYIRGSGNVSSVMRNAVGDYTITFATPLEDANYCFSFTATRGNEAPPYGTSQDERFAYGGLKGDNFTQTSSSIRFRTGYPANEVFYDLKYINVLIVR